MSGRGSAPDPAGGAYSTPRNPLARLRALLLKGREGGGEGRKRERWKVEERRGEVVVAYPPLFGRKLHP